MESIKKRKNGWERARNKIVGKHAIMNSERRRSRRAEMAGGQEVGWRVL